MTARLPGFAAYLDLASGQITPLGNVRRDYQNKACHNGLYVPNGVPDVACGRTCNETRTSLAHVPAETIQPTAGR
ncbi:MAG: hypothetical protein ACYTG0_29990 [Planctomycetota bacterium]